MGRTRCTVPKSAAIAATLFLGAVTHGVRAQGISVVVNDRPVAFTGTPPREMNGAVLVPLRGVFERMGATVNYDPDTKTIQAKKGSNSVSLVLGSTTAFVNGQPQTLVQPAAVIDGTALVPLRFVAQSFGGYVQWLAATRTVQIKTPEEHLSTLPPPPPSAVEEGRVLGALTGVYANTVPPQITLRVNGRNTAIPITDATIVLIQQGDRPATQQTINDLKTERQVRVTRNPDGTAQIIQAVYGEVTGVIKSITLQPDGSSVIGLTDGTSVQVLRGAPVTMGGRHLSLKDVMTAEKVVIRTDEENTHGTGVAVVTADDPHPIPPMLPQPPAPPSGQPFPGRTHPLAPYPGSASPQSGTMPLPPVKPSAFIPIRHGSSRNPSEWNSLACRPAAKRSPDAGLSRMVFRPKDDWRFADKRVNSIHSNVLRPASLDGPAPGATPPGVTVGVTVQSFSTNLTGPMRGREVFHVTLRGTPGGKAFYSIPNLSETIGLKETHPGVYEADYKTGNSVNITGAAVVGQLTAKDGSASPTIPAAQSVTIDNTPPVVTVLNPPMNATVASPRPELYALFSDGLGVGVDARSAHLLIDGKDVTSQATLTKTAAAYPPPSPLADGSHAARLIVADYLGNTAEKNWNFTVASQSNAAMTLRSDQSGDHADLGAGQELGLTLHASPGGKATYSLGSVIQNAPFVETAPGVYTALFKALPGRSVESAPVAADFKPRDGASVVIDLPQSVSVHADAPHPPAIFYPQDGQDIGKTITVAGRSAPYAAIDVKVAYVSKTLGIFTVTGTAAQQQVIANGKGQWRTVEFPLVVDSLSGKSQNTTFTVSAVAVDATGQASDPAIAKIMQE